MKTNDRYDQRDASPRVMSPHKWSRTNETRIIDQKYIPARRANDVVFKTDVNTLSSHHWCTSGVHLRFQINVVTSSSATLLAMQRTVIFGLCSLASLAVGMYLSQFLQKTPLLIANLIPPVNVVTSAPVLPDGRKRIVVWSSDFHIRCDTVLPTPSLNGVHRCFQSDQRYQRSTGFFQHRIHR